MSFHKDTNTKKLKIDYALFPVDLVKADRDKKTYEFHSKVSDEEAFTLPMKKCEFCHKKKDFVSYTTVIKTELSSLEDTETTYIPEIERRVKKKIPLRFRYKKKLKERLARIIDPSLP